MDNDLLARRLRPPSEPPRPNNGHSPMQRALLLRADAGAAQSATDDGPWATDFDGRAEVPWDRPEPETWPPTAEDRQPAPAGAAVAGRPSPAHVESVDELTGRGDHVSDARDAAATRPSTWDNVPTPWNQPTSAPWDAPASDAAAVARADRRAENVAEQPTPTEAVVSGRAPWDRPAPSGWDDFIVDDRPPEMFALYEDMVAVDDRPTQMSASPAAPAGQPSPAPAAPADGPASVRDAPSAQAAVADPYDADAPVVTDLTPAPSVTWPEWVSSSVAVASQPAQSVPADAASPGDAWGPWSDTDEAEADVQPDAESPARSDTGELAAADAGELAAANVLAEPTEERPADVEPVAQRASWAAPETAEAGASEPVVFRIELEIVGDSLRVRPIDAARRVGPTVVATASNSSETLAEEPSTPRRADFEPRSQPPSAAEETTRSPRAPWDDWARQATDAASSAPSPWAEPDPIAGWHLEPKAAVDPLAALPAATSASSAVPARRIAPESAAEQPDLWFLAEPQSTALDEPAGDASVAGARSWMTVGLTVVMAVVVVGLVIAFLLMFSSVLG